MALEFDDREARLSHPGGSVSFHLAGYGYGDQLQKPSNATLAAEGNRMEYRRGDLTEWYVNGSQGLEQGFTLARRPARQDAADREPLARTLAARIRSKLLAFALNYTVPDAWTKDRLFREFRQDSGATSKRSAGGHGMV